MEQPSSSTSPTAVRPLDAEGVPIERPPQIRGRRSGVVTAVVIGILAVVAVGAAIAWRTLTGTVYGAAETIPNDADIVLTIDFMQLRDVDRVDRFISAFADPMQQHGIIDEVTDLETAMREFDDVAQEEIGFRFAEDVLSWIGRSASLAIWVPDGLFDITSPESFEVPKVMLVLQVRDQEGAQEFLDRLVLDLEQDGAIIDQFDIAGTAAYTFDGDDPVVVALAEDRFVIGESTATVREALELEAADSIAQTDEFQLLAGAIGDDPIATVYASPALGSALEEAFASAGIELLASDEPATAAMGAMVLDEDGLVFRTAAPLAEGVAPTAVGVWPAQLPGATFGYVDMVLPEDFFSEAMDVLFTVAGDEDLTEADLRELAAPIDEVIGMSLIDDLLPQFGREVIFAAGPAADGALTADIDPGLGILFGIGVADSEVVGRAFDNATELLASEGFEFADVGGLRIVSIDGTPFASFRLDDDALFIGSSPDQLAQFGSDGGLTDSAIYERVDDVTVGDGLFMFTDFAAIVDAYVTDPAAGDILAPIAGMGVGSKVEGDVEVTEFRIVVDY